MNLTKNGIPIAPKHKQTSKFGKPYRHTYNPYTLFVTLYRREDFTPVWLVMPYIKKEVEALILEGWKVEETWNKR